MICCNGNIELEVSLSKKEAIWWQNRSAELGEESKIVSQDPTVESLDEALDYLVANSEQISKEVNEKNEMAMLVYQAFNMFNACSRDPGGQAFLKLAINDYIQSNPSTFILSIIDSPTIECPRCGSNNIVGPVGKADYNTCDKCAKSF